MTTSRTLDICQFYALLDELTQGLGGTRQLRDCSGRTGWPTSGVYFFFETGEVRPDGQAPRVVRIGSHALTATSHTRLWTRLAQHRGRLGGSNPGGGNHRGSVFRQHVGTALIVRDGLDGGLLRSWLSDRPEPAWQEPESDLERHVSAYIGGMPMLHLEVKERTERDVVERNSIALLSCRTASNEPPSASWLGDHATSEKVRTSGLWNVKHVDDQYDPTFLEILEANVKLTTEQHAASHGLGKGREK